MRRQSVISVLLVLLALMVVGLAACGDDTTTTEPQDSSTSADGQATTSSAGGDTGTTAAGEKPKVAFIYVSPLPGSAWTLAWDVARQNLEQELGVTTTQVGPIVENADVAAAMEDLIRQGNSVIFATAFGYQPFVHEVAIKYPDVTFVTIGPNTQEPLPNVSTVYGNLWESRYLTGIVAGLTTETDKIGFVAAHTIPAVLAGINGFALGVQSVNPDATVSVVVVDNWYDPARSAQAAESLAQAGSDVIAQHEDSIGTQTGANKAGVWGIGSEADTSALNPDTYLTGTVYNWNDYVIDVVEGVMAGGWEPKDDSFSLAQGVVGIGPIHADAPANAQSEADAAAEAIKSGELVIFTGPIYDNTGELRIAEGETWDVGQIYATDFFVKGVEGTIKQ